MTHRIPTGESRDARRTGRAVVLGASTAGMLAARVLAETFERVVVVERDPAPAGGATRQGTPQACQPHILLCAGLLEVERLFPGFLAELEADGIERYDVARDIAWWHRDGWKPRFESGLGVLAVERADLEERLRRRVYEVPNVRVLWGRAVSGLELDDEGQRVTGVTLDDLRGGPEVLEADLVVDATGARSPLPRMLAELGVQPAAEERLPIGLTYATGVFQLAPSTRRDWRALFVAPSSWRGPRGGTILPLGGDRVAVSLYGYNDDRPSTRESGFRTFAATLSSLEVARVLAAAKLLEPVQRFSVPYQLRRRYDRASLPDGVLALGDALHRLDPVFGQGMAVAALEAATLRRLLRRRRLRRDPARGVAAEFHAAAMRLSATPWSMGGGLARPDGAGRSWLARWARAYWRAAVRAGTADRRLHAAYLRVWHLERSPRSLWAPPLVARVLRHAALAQLGARPASPRRRPEPAAAPTQAGPRVEPEATTATGRLPVRVITAETLRLELSMRSSTGGASAA
ncbi:MAG TPA: FAD-dependent monooxygenase [Thermoanaerobaculia bacterium]|nr:FAD-dependent monooxygenase [Thermoanaerobaculia bacterium]